MLYFLGDSHLRPARTADLNGSFGTIPCKFEEVGGATAVGLRHPTSKTQALLRFRECLIPFRAGVVPIFQLGEVDCGFVIWVRAQKYGESVEQQVNESLAAYRHFLVEVRDLGYQSTIVTSAMLPNIPDEIPESEVARSRKDAQATLRQRAELTMEYNRILKIICAEEALTFVDFTPALLDPETRLLKEEYKHPDRRDHHLHPERGGQLWVEKLAPVISQLFLRESGGLADIT